MREAPTLLLELIPHNVEEIIERLRGHDYRSTISPAAFDEDAVHPTIHADANVSLAQYAGEACDVTDCLDPC